MSGWQPIHTAPKDGTIILAWRFYPVAIRWSDDDPDFKWQAIHLDGFLPFMSNGFCEDDEALRHWMPMPEAPNGHR